MTDVQIEQLSSINDNEYLIKSRNLKICSNAIKLYIKIFSEYPYEEDFAYDEVKEEFLNCISK